MPTPCLSIDLIFAAVAYLHLSYSYTAPFAPALRVTQDPKRTYAVSDHGVRRLRAEFLI
jgi:hypothetical protein